jgi:hypothetical protein
MVNCGYYYIIILASQPAVIFSLPPHSGGFLDHTQSVGHLSTSDRHVAGLIVVSACNFIDHLRVTGKRTRNYCVSTTLLVMRTRHNVTLFVHYLSCLFFTTGSNMANDSDLQICFAVSRG